MNYIYKQVKGVSVYQYDNGMIELATMKDGYRVKQSYNLMDYSINDALFMFKQYLKGLK